MNGLPSNKSALVLSGGGAYGAYEIGVIEALFGGHSPATRGEELKPDVYSGTSVGNYNAAFLAMNEGGPLESFLKLRSTWLERISDNGDGRGNGVYRFRGDPLDYLDPRTPGTPVEQLRRLVTDTASLSLNAAPRLLNLLSLNEKLSLRLKDLFDISALINVTPFRNLIRDTIRPASIRESGKALRVTATGWDTGDAQEFDFPRMTDEESWAAIRASAAIPGLFPPVELFGEKFIDGGVVLNTPIQPAVEAGATELHVISLNPKMTHLPDHHIENTFDTFNRVYAAMLAGKVDQDIATARWVNEGIEVLERIDAGEDVNDETMQRFVRVAKVISARLHRDGKMPAKLTIHRYFPSTPLGGIMGMLDFGREAVDSMISQGYAETCSHNCRASQCVIPAVVGRPEEVRKAAAA